MKILRAFPLFLVILIIYNLIMVFGEMPGALDKSLFGITLMSGAEWVMDVSDVLIVLGVLALYVEIFKATRTSVASVIDHAASTLVFVVFIVEFLTVKGAGNSTFLILGLMSLFDVIAGFTVTIVAARRDFAVGEALG